MIVVSCRRHFDSNRRLAPALQVREYPDPARSGDWRAATLDDLIGRAAGRRVCVLVHGYNNALSAILEAYAELHGRMADAGLTGPDGYGLVAGFAWPGFTGPEYPAARATANRAGLHLRALLQPLAAAAAAVDVEAHSLGARVALSALRKQDAVRIGCLRLLAAAVDYSILDPGRVFHSSLESCARAVVYHSRRDRTLRRAYPVGDLADGIQQALGCIGPRRPARALAACPNLYIVDCTAAVGDDHSGYRKSAACLAHWRRLLAGAPLPRTETLAP
jgi:esterase/lipase superfamily enzyme